MEWLVQESDADVKDGSKSAPENIWDEADSGGFVVITEAEDDEGEDEAPHHE